MNILVVASHPDDEVLGCGGTVAKLVEQEHRVETLFLTYGRAGIWNAIEASKKMKTRRPNPAPRFKDQTMDTEPYIKVVETIENEIQEFQPEVVYTHFPHDLNMDHRITAEAVLVATRPITAMSVRDIYAFEIPSSTEWNYGAPGFQPNVYEEIDLDKKMKALEPYKSEMREGLHPRSMLGIQALAWLRGSQVGVPAAEAFMLLRSVRPSWTNAS